MDPIELAANFSNILANAVIATHVQAKMILNRALQFRQESVLSAGAQLGGDLPELQSKAWYRRRPSPSPAGKIRFVVYSDLLFISI